MLMTRTTIRIGTKENNKTCIHPETCLSSLNNSNVLLKRKVEEAEGWRERERERQRAGEEQRALRRKSWMARRKKVW
jgi:hypothetical protein